MTIVKKIAILVMAMMMLIGTIPLAGCAEKASKYTEAEHIQRVTERAQKRFMTSKTEYTGFEVFPLYDENDELKYFLVEFTPQRFVYVLIRDEKLGKSMYSLSGMHDETPYSIAGVKVERRYLLYLRLDSAGGSLQIAAVKKDGKFINLISREEVEIVDGKLTKKQAEAEIIFLAKKQFDL